MTRMHIAKFELNLVHSCHWPLVNDTNACIRVIDRCHWLGLYYVGVVQMGIVQMGLVQMGLVQLGVVQLGVVQLGVVQVQIGKSNFSLLQLLQRNITSSPLAPLYHPVTEMEVK